MEGDIRVPCSTCRRDGVEFLGPRSSPPVRARMTLMVFPLLLGMLVFAPVLAAQGSSATAQDWENPRVYGINKEPGRATYTPFPDEASALTDGHLSTFT